MTEGEWYTVERDRVAGVVRVRQRAQVDRAVVDVDIACEVERPSVVVEERVAPVDEQLGIAPAGDGPAVLVEDCLARDLQRLAGAEVEGALV